jgi:hypothetical protein
MKASSGLFLFCRRVVNIFVFPANSDYFPLQGVF